MSPSRRCPWERWVLCPPRYPAPPTQVEANPQARAQTPDLAREEPRGSSRPRRPHALHLRPQASCRCHLRKTKTLRWRSKWRVVKNVSQNYSVRGSRATGLNGLVTPELYLTSELFPQAADFSFSLFLFLSPQSLRPCPPCPHRPSPRLAAQPRTLAHQAPRGLSALSHRQRARPLRQHPSPSP